EIAEAESPGDLRRVEPTAFVVARAVDQPDERSEREKKERPDIERAKAEGGNEAETCGNCQALPPAQTLQLTGHARDDLQDIAVLQQPGNRASHSRRPRVAA